MQSYHTSVSAAALSDRDELSFKTINANLAHGKNVHIAALIGLGNRLRSEEPSFLIKFKRMYFTDASELQMCETYLGRIPVEFDGALRLKPCSNQAAVRFQNARRP